jgi:hypothetical protein
VSARLIDETCEGCNHIVVVADCVPQMRIEETTLKRDISAALIHPTAGASSMTHGNSDTEAKGAAFDEHNINFPLLLLSMQYTIPQNLQTPTPSPGIRNEYHEKTSISGHIYTHNHQKVLRETKKGR